MWGRNRQEDIYEKTIKHLDSRVRALEEKIQALEAEKGAAEQSSTEPEVPPRSIEERVRILEETLETLKNMGLSQQMEAYLEQRQQMLGKIDQISTEVEKSVLDHQKEEEGVIRLRKEKSTIDAKIAEAMNNTAIFSDGLPCNPDLFNYSTECSLSRFSGQGLIITSYNGFDDDRIIIPREVNGQPVIGIEEKAFYNATFSEVILPSSMRVILSDAFSLCMNLKHIDLPDSVEHLGPFCFSHSGLTELTFPRALRMVPLKCCSCCRSLQKVVFRGNIEVIGTGAFSNCSKLAEISLPESVEIVWGDAFENTLITTLVFPTNVKKVENTAFGNKFSSDRKKVTCVFLGKDTVVEMSYDNKFYHVETIYCLPGSNVQHMAREECIPMKPLSEFRMEKP